MEEKFYSLKAYNIWHHVLYWIGNVCLYVLFIYTTMGIFKEPLINKLCYLPSQLIITYTLFYGVFPLIDQRKYTSGGLILLLFTYIATTIARILKIYVYETAIGHDAEKESIVEILTQQGPLLMQYMLWCYLTPIITTMIVLLINHYRREEKWGILIKEKSISELNFLKSQVHPHFLFNTLNNLYTLSLTNSPDTSKIAGKLHDILEYMFLKCNKAKVSLEEEVQLIRNYIELEKIRYNNKLNIKFTSNRIPDKISVAPLILITLVENAFKHGVSGSISDAFVDINFTFEDSILYFKVENSIPPNKKVDERGIRNGIGLSNMRKQLHLIYGERHRFESNSTQNQFFAYLTIDLSDGK